MYIYIYMYMTDQSARAGCDTRLDFLAKIHRIDLRVFSYILVAIPRLKSPICTTIYA